MRTEKALKNMIYSFGSYIFLFLSNIIIRKLLLKTFSTEMVGYEGVIADLFSFIALADFGLDSLFNYRLYQAFANNDKKRVNVLANMYKKLWAFLGSLVFIVCIILFFLLESIFANKVTNFVYLKYIFILYTISTICSYLFGYWRSILAASQVEYKAIRIETTLNFISFISRFGALLISKNIYIYMIANIGCTAIAKLFIYFAAKKNFDYISYTKLSFDDFRKERMIEECKQLIFIKTADVINWSSCNLLISLMINVSTSTYYSNYALIGAAVWAAISKFIKPIRASLADMVYKEKKEDSYKFFKTMDLANFFIASIIFVCYNVVFQQAITFFYGSEYLLSSYFVFFYSFLYYCAVKSETTNSFRECFGEYKIESCYAIFSILITIVLSYILTRYVGVVGIIISITISNFVVWHSRKVIVEKKFFNNSLYKSWFKELSFFLLAFIEFYLTSLIVKSFSYSFTSMISTCIIGMIIPTTINTLVFYKTNSFRTLASIILDIFQGLVVKFKH